MDTFTGDSSTINTTEKSPYGVVTMAVGVYVLHYRASSFLPADSLTWVAGPPLPIPLQCVAKMSDSSFLVVGGDNRRSVREYNTGNTNATATRFWGWEPESTWPSLETGRFSPACLILDGQMVVAGGWSSPTIETINLATKAVTRMKDMEKPRMFFQLAAFGEEDYMRLLALAGESELTALASVEWLEEESGIWHEAAGELATARSRVGAVAVTPEMLNCTDKCDTCNGSGLVKGSMNNETCAI